MQMRRCKRERQIPFARQFQQTVKQRDRIRPARKRDQDALVRRDQLARADFSGDEEG